MGDNLMPSAPLALVFGDPGPLAFLGHFRADAGGQGTVLRVAGRVGATVSATEANDAAAQVEALVRNVGRGVQRPDDRLEWVRAFWDALAGFDAATHLPSGGADFAALVVAADAKGVSVTGVGLAGCWYTSEMAVPRPLVPPAHPLLGPMGIPAVRPGAMTLNAVPTAVVAELRHPRVAPQGLRPGPLRAACGVRP